MPHLIVEYSRNLQHIDETALMDALTRVVCTHPSVSNEADVKTRIHGLQHYQIGLNSAGRGFVHVELRLLSGRTQEVKQELSEQLSQALRATLPAQPGVEVQLSVDLVDMDKACYFKGKL